MEGPFGVPPSGGKGGRSRQAPALAIPGGLKSLGPRLQTRPGVMHCGGCRVGHTPLFCVILSSPPFQHFSISTFQLFSAHSVAISGAAISGCISPPSQADSSAQRRGVA